MKGVIYYCTRARWIEEKEYRGDICHFTKETSPRHDIIEGFRESGIYLLRGTETPDYVVLNPKTQTGELKVVNFNGLADDKKRDAYFALESDTQGYWYIRSLSKGYNYAGVEDTSEHCKYYITANADGSVTLAPLEKGNNRQLWYLRSASTNLTTNKVFALHNKETGLYLNNDSSNKIISNNVGKTYYLEQLEVSASSGLTLDKVLFDADFYVTAYGGTNGLAKNATAAQAETHYKNTGKAAGLMPSPLFDPKYYLATHTDVANTYGKENYAKAYEHFTTYGIWEGRQGSVFFSVSEYYSRGPLFTDAEDYYHQDSNENLRYTLSGDKIHILNHFVNHGATENLKHENRAGSDEFDLKEFIEENKILPPADGYALLCDYVAGLIRFRNATGAELESFLFDVEYYKTDPDLTQTALNNAKIPGNTYDEQLEYHWDHLGKTEGRTASMYFSLPYYTSRYPDEIVNLSKGYDYYINTGHKEGHIPSEYVAMGLDPEILCRHEQRATALLPSCTGVCKRVEFCAACKFAVHVETSPALSHRDTDGNTKCDLCNNDITDALLSQSALLQLPVPVPDNEAVTDVSGFVHGSDPKPVGTYYIVQKNRDSIYRVFNPLTQSSIGTIAATQVFDIRGGILGVDPDMGVEIFYSSNNNTSTNHYYFKMEGEHFLGIRNGNYPLNSNEITRDKSGVNITITPDVDAGNLSLIRTCKDINNPTENKSLHYLCLEQRLGMEYFEWSYSETLRQSEDVVYLYRLIENRLNTEGLYAALQKAVSYVPNHNLYQQKVYKEFLSVAEDAKALYEQYNGLTLTGNALAQKASIQATLDRIERKLLDLMSILSINTEREDGRIVDYFDATFYNWNEDGMNQLVQKLEDSDAKGFYFETADNKGNSTASFSNYDKNTKENVNGYNTYAQMYSIYSGIAAPDLYKAKNPPFHNENVVAADYWSTKEIENTKEVYTDVKVPFIYDKDGYFTLNSDTNGVFFEGEPASGATLAILDKPMSYCWTGGHNYGVGVPGYYAENSYGHRPSNGYVTAFQPFGTPTRVNGTGYLSSASNFSVSSGTDSYLMDGVALAAGSKLVTEKYGRGTPTWGFGMQLNLPFHMTEDGNLAGDSNRPITFSFSGDDDVWIYIDSKLVMELGGSHDAIQGHINFATGDVTVTSTKYGRIRDKNLSGYGHGSDATQYGSNITANGSILNGQPMKQKNIYTQVLGQSVAEFAADGEHTLSIYYMDRGKGRTNCSIRFNMPQSDIVVAEKNIAPYYGNEDGTLTNTPISDSTMAYLNTLDFGYTLKANDYGVAYHGYRLYDKNGLFAGEFKTDINGHFTLKNGQKAEFDNLQFNGQNYHIEEDPAGPRWGKISWTGTANEQPLSPTTGAVSPSASVTGDQYTTETISYVCTNTYIYNPELNPEELVVVMDYGKPMDIPVIDDAVIDGISELITREGKIIDLVEGSGGQYAGAMTSHDPNRKSVRVTLKRMLEAPFKFKANIQLTLDDGTARTATVPITVLPATLMYYETNFINRYAVTPPFQFTVKNPQSDAYEWVDVTSDGKDTLQDGGEVGDIVYKPVIDREFIPSNAFFVDFDGKGYQDRYSVDPIYKGHDFDSGNWIARFIEDPTLKADGSYSYTYTQDCTIDQETDTMSLPVTGSFSQTNSDVKTRVYGPEFHTGTKTNNYSKDTLQYRYSENDFCEIRFKTEGCVLAVGHESPRLALRLRYLDSEDKIQEIVAYCPFTLQNGTWQTLSFDLAEALSNTALKKLPKETFVTIGVRFQYILWAEENVPGSVTVDYLYVGPEKGWLDSVESDYLLFGFDGTPADTMRYNAAAYGMKDFDLKENNPNWAVSHGVGNFTISNVDGTLSYGVTKNPNNNAICGPRIMTTGKANTIPTTSNGIVADTAILNFDLRNAEYIQIRFKLDNCTWSADDPLHQIVFLYNYKKADGTEAYGEDIRIDYNGETEEYQTIRVPLTEAYKIKKEGVTLTNLGVRFRSIMGKNNADGKVIIDQLFIGSKEAMLRLDDSETGMFFDFDNTEADRNRYSSSIYGGYNFDDPVNRHWAMSYGGASQATGNADPQNLNRLSFENGLIRLNVVNEPGKDVPYMNQTRFGTTAIPYTEGNTDYPAGYYPWNTNPDRMPLQFPSNHADYVQIRFRVQDCEQIPDRGKPTIGVIFYYENQYGSIDFEICDSSKYDIPTDPNEFITLTYSTGDILEISETIIGFGVIFRNLRCKTGCEETAAYYVDYLYIGKMEEANPTADTIFIGFDNMDADQNRYACDTYGHVNPDEVSPLHWWHNTDKVGSITVRNNLGVAEMVAVPKLDIRDKEGNILFPDLYMETASDATKSNTDYLDFKPENAELYQIRFKLENLTIGTTINEDESPRTVGPYVKLQWQTAANASTEAPTVDASEPFILRSDDLNTGKWITVTAKIPKEARNVHSIMSIRPYFGGMESLEGKQGKITIDYIYIGPDDRPDQVYGYDSHYNNDTTLSDGHSFFVEGSGVKVSDTTATYTETSFSFKGTGFDIISRTGPKQATIRVEVWKSGAKEPVKRLTVNNKGELELYQIPVVSVQGLDYGTYTVKLWVNKAVDSQYDVLKRGGEFYFDAVRIYDPMNRGTTTNSNAVPAYRADRELYPHIKEIRNILLTKESFESLTDSVEGAVFVDVNSSTVDPETGTVPKPSDEYITADVQTYNKLGPKNEVYLAPNQAVAFNLLVSTNQPIVSLDIGAKTIVNCSGKLKVGILAKDANGDYTITAQSEFTVSGATAQYWPLDLTNVQVKATETGEYQPMYLVFYNDSPAGDNSGKNVISLTDVKVAYQWNPEGPSMDDSPNDPEVAKRNAETEVVPVSFMVDRDTLPATKHFVKAVNETPVVDPDAKIGHSLNLTSDIAINFILRKRDLENYDSFFLECYVPIYEGNTYITDKKVRLSPVNKGDYWYFTLDGLTALQMADVISAKLVMLSGGRTYYSETDTYSIAQYATAQLNNSNASRSLKTLCANLLRYGAKAQIFKGYRIDNLADRNLTAEQKTLLTDLNSLSFGSNNKVTSTLPNPKVTWAGKTLILDSKVTVRFVVDVHDATLSAGDLTLRIRYTDYKGIEREAVVPQAHQYANTAGRYAFDFNGLLAAELRTVLSATVYYGDTPVSDTLCYSVDTYCSDKSGALGTLCKALMAYSDCAKAFFG